MRGEKMIIKCEICGASSIFDETPKNKFCPVCLTPGALYIEKHPEDVDIKGLIEIFGEERVNREIMD